MSLTSPPGRSSEEDAVLWNSLRSGEHFAMLRHAIAPGTGDPSGFKLDNCRTQRNLSEEARNQAVKIGKLFRENEIQTARVFSSQWCRCLETAKLLERGPVQPLSSLNAFNNYQYRESQTQKPTEWLHKQNLDPPLVLGTHQVNITALSHVSPSSGERAIIHRSKNGEISVAGTIVTE
jgi:broad specificity phosphatase PhoE